MPDDDEFPPGIMPPGPPLPPAVTLPPGGMPPEGPAVLPLATALSVAILPVADVVDDDVPVQPAKAATASISAMDAMNHLLIFIEDHTFLYQEIPMASYIRHMGAVIYWMKDG